MRTIGLALAAAAVAGCVQAVPQPDFLGWDRAVYAYVECDRAKTGLPTCFDNARRICPEGYQLAEQRYNTNGDARGSLVVRCGPPPPPAPVVSIRDRPARAPVIAPK